MQKKIAISPILRTDVFQEVFRRLEAFVSDASFKPGDRLPSERDLADRLGVSRTSVRQALKILEATGRITSRIGSGTYIAEQPSPSHGTVVGIPVPLVVNTSYLSRIIAARALIESEIFGRFCGEATERQMQEVGMLLEENHRDIFSNADECVSLDLSFEGRVGELLGDEVLYALQKQVHQAWIMTWVRWGHVPDHPDALEAEHRELLFALKERKCEQVVQLIREHVHRTM